MRDFVFKNAILTAAISGTNNAGTGCTLGKGKFFAIPRLRRKIVYQRTATQTKNELCNVNYGLCEWRCGWTLGEGTTRIFLSPPTVCRRPGCSEWTNDAHTECVCVLFLPKRANWVENASLWNSRKTIANAKSEWDSVKSLEALHRAFQENLREKNL